MKEMLSKAYDRKQTIQNFSCKHWKSILKKNQKTRWFDRIRTKTSSRRILRQSRRDTSEPNGKLKYQLFYVGFKGQSHMFGLCIFSTQKYNRKISFWISLRHLFIFLIDAVKLFLKNASITHFKFVETRPRDNKTL